MFSSSSRQNVKMAQLKTGVVQNACSGSMVVPTDGGLVKGQAYYARVFAYSPIGFSQSQVGLKTRKIRSSLCSIPAVHMF